MTEIKRISDIYSPAWGQHPRKSLNEIAGQDIIIHEVKKAEGFSGDVVVITASKDGKEFFNIVTGAQVVMKKLLAVQDKLPVMAKVVIRRGSKGRFYYDIE